MPDEGLTLRRRYELGRTPDGVLRLWVSREAAPGARMASSGLRFDAMNVSLSGGFSRWAGRLLELQDQEVGNLIAFLAAAHDIGKVSPGFQNQIERFRDLLPATLWRSKKARFLDPGCKSGVFLREIAKRLDKGLEKQIPDRAMRLNHIFKQQLYGLAITELTALLSRRSVYCSKTANGQYSVCDSFDNAEGNIRFSRVEHTWKKGHCIYCGANPKSYERGAEPWRTHRAKLSQLRLHVSRLLSVLGRL